jgi:hypothetical protein
VNNDKDTDGPVSVANGAAPMRRSTAKARSVCPRICATCAHKTYDGEGGWVCDRGVSGAGGEAGDHEDITTTCRLWKPS